MNNENEERIREYNLKIAYKNGIIEGVNYRLLKGAAC